MQVIYYSIFYFLFAFVPIFSIFYFYYTSNYNYWKDRGVPYIKPSFPFGNLGGPIMGRKSLIDLTNEQYRQFEGERFFGIFNMNKPALVLRDLSLIEKVLMTDFTYFCDRVDGATANNDFLSFYLGNLQGDKWRQLRHKLNGAFSTNKLKQMTKQMSKCGDSFVEKIGGYESKKEAALCDCLGFLFSQQVIASCVFGVEYSGEGGTTFFQNVKRKLFNMKVVHLIILWYMYIPDYTKWLYFIPAIAKVVEYFNNLTLATIQVRRQSKTGRNDFLQVLLDLKEEEETIETDFNNHTGLKNGETALERSKKSQERKRSSSESSQVLSDRCIASQLFLFLSFGLELSAVSITFLLYDLASNLHVQQNVQQEIDAVINKFGELNYEALQQLNYLDLVIQESLRLRSGYPYITRVCQIPYNIPGSDLVVEKGVTIVIPTTAIHLDSQNYPDPEKFDPNRFVDNHFKPSAHNLVFGAGPRMCIAFKLVVLELKIAIAKVMQKFLVRLSSKTQHPICYAPKFMPSVLNGIWVEFESRTPTTN